MALAKIKKSITNNLKNIYGWKTDRKIVVFSVDDYGNVRIDSKEAIKELNKSGIKVKSPFRGFDLYDTLETKDDLEMLFNTLTSVTDKIGRHAVFTPFSVPCNIDFERVEESNFCEFHNETLDVTFKKLAAKQPAAYEGAWSIWKEGISKKIMVPQFHGREHVNLKAFNEKLKNKDHDLITSLQNRSFFRVSNPEFTSISLTAAFDFWDKSENHGFHNIVKEGLDAFEKVFGYRATHFNSPAGREHSSLHPILKECGIKYIDTPFIKSEHQGLGKNKKSINFTGKKNKFDQIIIVRNVLFEPTKPDVNDWVSATMRQIEYAFKWNRPAIISSHRVNFCGHIDEKNRKKGLDSLRKLLKNIIKKWPEVEFMAANELAEIIYNEKYDQ